MRAAVWAAFCANSYIHVFDMYSYIPRAALLRCCLPSRAFPMHIHQVKWSVCICIYVDVCWRGLQTVEHMHVYGKQCVNIECDVCGGICLIACVIASGWQWLAWLYSSAWLSCCRPFAICITPTHIHTRADNTFFHTHTHTLWCNTAHFMQGPARDTYIFPLWHMWVYVDVHRCLLTRVVRLVSRS